MSEPESEPEPDPEPPPVLDLGRICDTVDQVLELVHEWAPGEDGPVVNDWNDLFLVAAFARGYRCLRSVREVAGRAEADDAAVLTRALVALTLRYLWLGRAEGEDERNDRLRLLQRKWATERATLGEELEELGHLPPGTSREFRERADQLQAEGVPRMPTDQAIAQQLDQDLAPEAPRFFELVYARIYRTTGEVSHYGIGALLDGFVEPPIGSPGALEIDRQDEQGAAEALGLALITFAFLADFSEPVVRHGLTPRIAELVQEHHQALRAGLPQEGDAVDLGQDQ